MTNYERIKNMSIDEMTGFILIDLSRFCVHKKCVKDCFSCTKEWLESGEEENDKVDSCS